MNTDQTNENKGTEKGLIKLYLIIISVFLVIGLVLFFTGLLTINKGENITVTINHINVNTYHSGESKKTTYSVYVDYTYKGEKYTNIRYPSYKSGMQTGDTIDAKINPNNPTKFYSSKDKIIKGGGFITLSLLLIIAIIKSKKDILFKKEN